MEKDKQLLATRHIPDPRRRVLACGYQIPAIGGERHAADQITMALEVAEISPGLRVPQLHSSILATRRDDLTIRREGYTPYLSSIAGKDAQLLTGLPIPESRCVVIAAGQHLPAIRREGDAMDRAGVANKALHRERARQCAAQYIGHLRRVAILDTV